MRSSDELGGLVEAYLDGLALTPELGALDEAVRYSLGGKRVRPVLCLATAEAVGLDAEKALPAAAAVELVHSFSLVHDDLPALDDDERRRERPSTWALFGEGVAVLAGDALLAEAFRLALEYDTPAVARELVRATLGMIGGQYLDIAGSDVELAELHRLKTGCLFGASVGCALAAAELPPSEWAPWRAFADELGLLFQVVDDILDGDGYVALHGAEAARLLADGTGAAAQARLEEIAADTSVLAEIVGGLSARTS
jgi:geranylgeranyl diphosphate synthase type II